MKSLRFALIWTYLLAVLGIQANAQNHTQWSLPASITGYDQWLKLNAQPIPPVQGGDPHRGTKDVYVNQTRESLAPNGQQQFPYPDGTIVVKEAIRPGKDFIGLVAVMWKEAGSNPAAGDWRFEEFTRSAPDAEFRLIASGALCSGCHARAAATDFVFTPLEEKQVPIVRITPSPIQSPYRGEEIRFALDIEGGENVAGYQAKVKFSTAAFRYVRSDYGNYLPEGTLFIPASVLITGDAGYVTFEATAIGGVSNGDGTIATLTLEVNNALASTVILSDVILTNSAGQTTIPRLVHGKVVAPPERFGDVNQDGMVNILDLVQVANGFGQMGENDADVNGDGVVNIVDLVKVAGAL